MAPGLMVGNIQTHHGREAEGRRHWEYTDPDEEPCTYNMAFPATGVLRKFPVEGCPEQSSMRTAMRVQFSHRHVRDNVIILEELNLLHPR